MTRSFADLHRPGVLIVDDEQAVRTLLATVLPLYGLDVWSAATGHEAVGLYQAHWPDIAVVLLDVRMPGMDGPATLTALRKINPEVRGCFMSGDTGDYAVADLFGLGVDHIFPKPFADWCLVAQQLFAEGEMARHYEPIRRLAIGLSQGKV